MASEKAVMKQFELRLASLERVIYAMASEMRIEVPEPLESIAPPSRAELKEKHLAPDAPSEIVATDGAIELASEHGIDLSEIEGSGADGKIIKADVAKAVA